MVATLTAAVQLVYGVGPDGRMTHIREVSSGLACDCRCPTCGRKLVAKKGETRADHFAHAHSAACKSAPETALHLVAKDIIKDRLKLSLPAVDATYQSISRRIHDAKVILFDHAQMEPTEFNGIIPDLYVTRDGHRLLIEIFVTHACDDAKRARLQCENIATVEIDLSALPRDASRERVEEAVLSDAPRYWIYHPRIIAEEAALKADYDRRAALARRKFENAALKIAEIYKTSGRALANGIATSPETIGLDEIFDLSDVTGLPIDGFENYSVPPTQWQKALLTHILEAPQTLRTKPLFDWLKSNGFVRTGLEYVDTQTELYIQTFMPEFRSAYHALQAYLTFLVEENVLVRSNGYTLSTLLREKAEFIKDRDRKRNDRLRTINAKAAIIFAAIPLPDLGSLIPNDWLDCIQSNGLSIRQAIMTDDERFGDFDGQANQIIKMLNSEKHLTQEFLGLPLQRVFNQQTERRKAAEAARQTAKEEERLRDIKQRGLRLGKEAVQLGVDWDSWITAPHPDLNSRAPISLAEESEVSLRKVLDILDLDINQRARAADRERQLSMLHAKLQGAVAELLDPDRTNAFLTSSNRLGPQEILARPLDYCVCYTTFSHCIDRAKVVAKSLRR